VPRIASLLPSATEIVGALGLADQLVGVSHECDHPPAVARLPRLTASLLPGGAAPALVDRLVAESLHAHRTLYRLDGELLSRLRPDVILTQELCDVCAVRYDHVERAVRALRGEGGSAPTLLSLEPTTLDDVLATIGTVARELGVPERGAHLAARLRARLDAVAAAGRALPDRPRVLLLEWTDPPFVGGHWVPGMVELAGGANVEVQQARAGQRSVRLEWDAVAAADPDLIAVAPCGYGLDRVVGLTLGLVDHAVWSGLRAVRGGAVWAVDANSYFSRSGPRLVDGVELLHELFARRPDAVAGRARRIALPGRSAGTGAGAR
jgi:iron complex transport system substrate-binding protein